MTPLPKDDAHFLADLAEYFESYEFRFLHTSDDLSQEYAARLRAIAMRSNR